MFYHFSYLHRNGFMGINKRNLEYLFQVNERKRYPLVDNKLLSKKLLTLNNLSVPTLYTVFKSHSELKYLEKRLVFLNSFVVKPGRGTCGYGVLILEKKEENLWSDPLGNSWDSDELRQHISFIISGIFSIAAHPDVAMIEEKIESPDFLQSVVPIGLPDIRIIVYKGVPAMAMLRLPTFLSKGRSNLHQEAIGVGIDMVNGYTLLGVYRHRTVTTHPDTGRILSGIHIPYWGEILAMAVKACDVVEFGYVGVDIVIDKNRGPLILEINARPGLSIQIVNSIGLVHCLKSIDRLEKRKQFII